jgi:hypothetical protein
MNHNIRIIIPNLIAAVCIASLPACATSNSAKMKTAQRQLETPKYEFQTWHQGEPPVRLIHHEDGFCALTRITGHFQGGGERVQVYIGPDGYWYLGGNSMQEGVSAQCIVVRYH